jgi:ureidoacrylate peracid hydrolase
MVKFQIDPKRTALLNVDLQNVFVEGYPVSAPDGLKVVARVNRLIKTCRAHDMMIVHTAHVTRPDGSNVGVMGEIIPPVREGMIAQGGHAAALHPTLDVQPSDIRIDKPRFGAFHATDLELILRSHGIDTLLISGIATNVCAETTAREANARDFGVLFLSDGTATFDMNGVPGEQLQRATCATLGFAFAEIVTVDQVIARIEEAS